ncbi:hypothetical protein MRX96_048221 [Rhipicephalus microplus]
MMPDKAQQEAFGSNASRIIEQLSTRLERQVTPDYSFRLPLALPTYKGHTEKFSQGLFARVAKLSRRASPSQTRLFCYAFCPSPVWLCHMFASSPVFRQLVSL